MKLVSALTFFILLSVLVFGQDYNMSTTTVNTCSGTFYDNNGSGANYSSSQSLTMTFTSDNGNRISFNFQTFALYADGYDYLQIYDGPSNAYPSLGTYFGTTSPGIVTSTGTSLTFYFYSNGSYAAAGWSAIISCTTAPLPYYTISAGTTTTCSGVFFDTGGGNGGYNNNENVTQTFTSSSGNYIFFDFTHFAVSTDDTLYAYDGTSTAAPLIGKYYGTNLPERIYSKSGSSITFRFASNTVNTAAGWRALISCSSTAPSQEFNMQNGIRYTCGGTFYDEGGSSASYPSSTSKTMTFYSDNGNRISMNFQTFALYSDGYDYLQIFDGPTSSHPLLGTYYGTSTPGIVTSTGTSLTFYFYSNGSYASSGWSAIISCTTAPLPYYNMNAGTTTTCSGVFFDSGGGNANYQNNENIIQTFTSSSGNYIIFDFTHFNVNTDDTLYAYDGTTTAAPLMGKYYGTQVPERIYSKSGSSVTFRFVSGTTGNSSGWRALISCSATPPAQEFRMQNGVRYTCGGAFYDEGGPSGDYPSSTSRTMTFYSSNGNRISFDMQQFALYNDGYDYLQIYDGPTTSHPLIGTYYASNNPGVITSTGTCLTFYFYSNGSYGGIGWGAAISCTTPPLDYYPISTSNVNTCSGVFFDSGGGNANYQNNENITQTFTSSSGNYIIFDFTHFNVSTDDTLYAYDGTNTSAPLIGKYYGTQLPGKVFSKTGSSVTFRFYSGTTNVASGWRALISCSATLPQQDFLMQNGVRYTCSGNFYDEGGPSYNYPASTNRTMTFYGENGNRISINFTSFYTESGWDVMSVYDGPSSAYPLLGQYSGSATPGTLTSTGNCLTINFYCDGSNSYSGWAASISCAGTPLPYYPITSTTVTTCDGVFFDSGGGNNNYANNENATQTFTSSSGNYIIFDFSHFNLSSDDTLFAYDGTSTAAPLIGKYYGNQLPEKIYSKSGSSVTFRFLSNTVNVATGWRALISCSSTPPQQDFWMQNGVRYTCGGNFYDEGGPSYNYPSSTSRTMTFYSDNGNRISVNFASISTESCCDYIRVYDGPSTAYPLLGQYGGTTSPGTITSTGTCLTFYFYSDGTSNYSGWNATISCAGTPLPYYPLTSGTTTTCEGVFFDSGNGNNNYANNENLTQTFTSPSGNYIIFDFTHFNVSTDDTLYAYDGTSIAAPLIGKYYGTQLPEKIYSKSGSSVTFRFVSNTVNVVSGWRALISCSAVPPQQDFVMQNGIRYTCGGNFYDEGGLSYNYPNSTSRTMTFYSDNGNRISVNFASISTESCCDYLRVYDGPSTAYPLIGQYGGTTSPGTITSTGTSLTFYFYSDGSNTYAGWNAAFSCATPPLTAYPLTGGTVNTCSGVFYDAGGPAANYPHNENRTQTFCSDNGSYIKFNFQPNNFTLNSDDSLYVYDGPSTSSPILAIYTGSINTEEISSQSGSCLTFRFVSNTVNNAIGWQSLISCSTTPSPMNSFNMSNGVRYTCNASFYDSGGPSYNYPSSDNRTMTFRSNSGCPISVNFTSFSTESCCDKLYMYDGPNTTATLIGTYGGSAIPPSFTSTGDALTFRFSSDGSGTYSGWNASLTCSQAGITANPGLTACPGQTVTLTASAGNAYLWNTGATTQSIDVTTAGIYSVTVTDGSCNLVSNSVYVSFFNTSSVSITPSGPTTFCHSGSVILTATSGSSYQWSSGQTSQSITTTTAGNYYVTVTSVNGCTAVAGPITITVNSTPAVPTQLFGPVSVCSGATGVNYSIAAVSGATGYEWTLPSGASVISGQGTNAVVVDWGTNSGFLYVHAVNGTCSGPALDTYITVNTVPAQPGSIIGSAAPCEGSTQTYSVSNVSGTTYTWSLPTDWTQTGGGTSSSITVTTGAQAGTITVTPSNSCGNGTAQTISVTPANLPPSTSAISGNNMPCNLSTQTYSVSDMPGYTFNWDIPSGWTIVSGSTTNQITIVPEVSGGMIAVNAVNSCGNGPIAYFGVNPTPLPVINLGPDSTLCETDVMVLSVNPGYSNYIWSTGISGVNFITVDYALLGTGTHLVTLTVTDNNGCTGSDQVYITYEICSGSHTAVIQPGITVFPNPTSSFLYVKSDAEITHPMQLEITDLQGRSLSLCTMMQNTMQLDLSELPAGMYLLKIVCNDQNNVFRIVKE